MDVKSAVDRVRSKLTDEQLSEVGSDLETIKSGYLEKVDEAKAAVSESMERKRKIRTDKEEIENLTIDRDTWKTKGKWTGYVNTMKESFDNYFNTAKESDNWKRVESEYVVPVEGKELTSDEVENNIEKMNYHKKLGLFEEQAAPKPKPPTDKSFKFSDEKIPTTAEYNDIRREHGPDSYEARKAMELIRKFK